MLPTWVSTVFIAFFLSLHGSYHYVEGLSDPERLKELTSIAKSSQSNLISSSVSKFRSYVEVAPRSYNLMVMFSADQKLCKPCAQMRNQVRTVSSDFKGLGSRNSASLPTFFMEVKLSASDQAFLGDYGIQHVPIFYFFPAGKSNSYPKRLDYGSVNSFDLQKLGIHANVLKQFVNDRTGSKFRVVRGGYEIPFVQTVRKLMPYIVTVFGISAIIAIFTGAYKSPMLWFALVVLVYIFSVGGGHYSWIHNTPLAVVDKNGKTQYIAGGSRSQYVAEGFFVSVTCVCISGLVIAIQELPKIIPQKAGQSFIGFTMFCMTGGAIGALLLLYKMVSICFYYVFACFVARFASLNRYLLQSSNCFVSCSEILLNARHRKCHNISITAKCNQVVFNERFTIHHNFQRTATR